MTDATTLADRALIRLSGEDVRGFLQGLVTNDVGGALPVWAGLLNPQGKVLFEFLIWADGDDILLDCERGRAEALARRLTLYRLRRPIAIALDAGLAVHWSPDGGGAPDPRLPALGRRWLAPPTAPAPGWPAHRLSLGVTEGLAELGDGTTLWLECNARELNGVSFTKGCYIGQENTARMNYRSTVNRRLVVAPLGDAGGRTRAAYPDLALMVEHRRVEALGDALVPAWLAAAAVTGAAADPGMSERLRDNIAVMAERERFEAARMSRSDRIADRITGFTGSMTFVVVHLLLFGGWIVANLGWIPGLPRFDPSFVVLAMAASVEAIFLSTFVLISQNRMATAASRRADLDLHINLLAEHELSRVAELVIRIAERVGVRGDAPELAEITKDVEAVKVLEALDESRG